VYIEHFVQGNTCKIVLGKQWIFISYTVQECIILPNSCWSVN